MSKVFDKFLLSYSIKSFKKLSGTRWSARDDVSASFNRDWDEVIEALTIITKDENEKPNTRSEPSGYLRRVKRLETAILLTLWGDWLSRFNITSKKLKSSGHDLFVFAKLY